MPKLIRLRPHETRFGRSLAWASQGLALGACVVLALMMYLVFADVLLRYAFTAPIAGSVEIIYCLMGLLIAMGLGLVTYENGHVRVDIITTVLPPKGRAACDALAHFLSVIAAGLICWRLAITAIDQTRDLNETQVLALPVWLVALVMALCSILLVLTLILHLFSALSALASRKPKH
jgi:TRAP-type C4-dicarboxylate transport system permease small subunit